MLGAGGLARGIVQVQEGDLMARPTSLAKDRRRMVSYGGHRVEAGLFCRPGSPVESFVQRLLAEKRDGIEERCILLRARGMPMDPESTLEVLRGRRPDGWGVEATKTATGRVEVRMADRRASGGVEATVLLTTDADPHPDDVRLLYMVAYLVCKLVKPE